MDPFLVEDDSIDQRAVLDRTALLLLNLDVVKIYVNLALFVACNRLHGIDANVGEECFDGPC